MRELAIICLLLFTTLSASASASAVEQSKWVKVLDNNKCPQDGGFYFWNEKECIISDDKIRINGKWIKIEFISFKQIHKKSKEKDSPGDKTLSVYSGNDIKVTFAKTLLPGCYEWGESCTVTNFYGTLTIKFQDGRVIRIEGAGIEGA